MMNGLYKGTRNITSITILRIWEFYSDFFSYEIWYITPV